MYRTWISQNEAKLTTMPMKPDKKKSTGWYATSTYAPVARMSGNSNTSATLNRHSVLAGAR